MYFTALPRSPCALSSFCRICGMLRSFKGYHCRAAWPQAVPPAQCGSSFLLHSYFYSLGFWIFQASNSCFSLFEHFAWILPLANLWFHSKLFHNLGHNFGMTIFPKHCSAAQKRAAAPSKAGFCLKVVTRWFSSPCEYVRIWEMPCFPYVNIHYKKFKYLLLVAHTIKMKQCVVSSHKWPPQASENPVLNLSVVSSVCV